MRRPNKGISVRRRSGIGRVGERCLCKSTQGVEQKKWEKLSMAEKRMFTKSIIDSDAFLEMPLSAQALYFHLNMRADDDGFIKNPNRITSYVGASIDDLRICHSLVHE